MEKITAEPGGKSLPPLVPAPWCLLPIKFNTVPVDKEDMFKHPRWPMESGFGTERQIH